jgi:hypothetical protein
VSAVLYCRRSGECAVLPRHGFEIRNPITGFVAFRRTYYDVPAPSG